MRVKKVLLGILVVGLMVVALSEMGWGDSNSDVGDSPSVSLSPTVKWHIPKWIYIYIPSDDTDVTLTEVQEVTSPATPPTEGTIVYRMTETGTHSVYVLTNNTDGFTTTVTGSDGGGTAASVDTARFEIKGGKLENNWTAVSTKPKVLSGDSNGLSSATDIQY